MAVDAPLGSFTLVLPQANAYAMIRRRAFGRHLLIAIARCSVVSNSEHVRILPPSWGKLVPHSKWRGTRRLGRSKLRRMDWASCRHRDYVEPFLVQGQLVTVLEDWAPPPFDGFFLYYPSRRHIRSPLRAFIDSCVKRQTSTPTPA
jgi:DNA-binding transcriptional LysR family regulator